MRRLLLVPIAAVILVLATASAAFACGSLIGPNGAVQLVRTSTLAAWHDGVERYVTNSSSAERAEVVRIDHAAARQAFEGRAGRRLDAATSRPRGHAAPASPRRRRRQDRARHAASK